MSAEKPYRPDPSTYAATRVLTKEALDRCLSCHWADPNNIRPVSPTEIAACTNVPDPAKRLRDLRKRGIAESTPVEDGGPRRLLFTPTATPEARAYIEKLPKEPCMSRSRNPVTAKKYALPPTEVPGATTSKALADANAEAEAWLLEKTGNITAEPLDRRRHTLGCIACHLFGDAEGYVTSRTLSDCTARSTESTYDFLRLLQDEDLFTTTRTDETLPAVRQPFTLASTEAAVEFGRRLTPPQVCAFKAGKLLHEQGTPIVGPTIPLSEMIPLRQPPPTVTE